MKTFRLLAVFVIFSAGFNCASALTLLEESQQCARNLKQVSLAIRIWAGDHNDAYPFNVAAADGGTKDFCGRDPDGFDTNGWIHFLAVSNELGSPVVLVCPSDSKSAAGSFSLVGRETVSYQIRTDSKVSESNPDEILLKCPIHGHLGMTDGSIRIDYSSVAKKLEAAASDDNSARRELGRLHLMAG